MQRLFKNAIKIPVQKHQTIDVESGVYLITKGHVCAYIYGGGTRNILLIFKPGSQATITVTVDPQANFKVRAIRVSSLAK